MSEPAPELDVVVAFRRRLVALPEPRRTSRWPAAAAASALAAVALVAVVTATGGPSDALAITRGATTLELRIADASADAVQMTRELNDAGIRGRVVVVPVAPRLAGTWVLTGEIAGHRATCISPHGAAPVAETVRLDAIENAGRVLRIPIARVRESSGSFVLVAGREARDGEGVVDVGSPAVVRREVFGPLLGPSPARLPAC